MALSQLSETWTRPAQGPVPSGSSWLRRVAGVVLPAILLLVWTAAVRLPFYAINNGDEYFFAVVADEWLRGGLPYVATFDIKPPGLFFIYAAVQSVFGASYAAFKGMEICAVAFGAWVLYATLRTHGTVRAALWVAILYPVYTLAFDGTAAVNMLLQLPLLILGFSAALSAIRDDAGSERLLSAFLAGAAIGAAGMIKQTAVFEAMGAFVVIAALGPWGSRIRMLLLFAVGAALPAAAFSAYFLALGHFREMFDAVIVLALQRVNHDVVASYGPDLAHYLSLPGAAANSLMRSGTVVFLWAGAIFAVLRRDRITKFFPGRVLIVAAVWLVASFASVVVGRLLVDYYLLAIIPPLLILAGAAFCHGFDVPPAMSRIAFAASLVAAIASLAVTERKALFAFEKYRAEHDLLDRASAEIRALGITPDDRLLVLNRGLALHVVTGARPPSPYFHGVHLLTPFRTPSADPLGESLATNPRFIVLADPSQRLFAESSDLHRRATAYLAAHYRAAAFVTGEMDSFTVYEFVR